MYKTVFSAFFMLLFATAFSQAGSIDPTYGSGGSSAVAPQATDLAAMAIQSDGKIVLTGTTSDPELYRVALVGRYTAAGAVDRLFSGDGVLTERNDLNAAIFGNDIAVQKDGKVVVAGVITTDERTGDLAVIRYNIDGTRDNTFGAGGLVTAAYEFGSGSSPQVVVQSDGKIIVAAIDARSTVSIFEFNADGSLFKTLKTGASASDGVSPYLSAYPDGGYVASYLAADGTGNNPKAVVYSSRFGEKSFGFPGGTAWMGNADHAILASGKIAVAGTKVMLLNANGSVDTGFGTSGFATLPFSNASYIASEPNGKLLVEGFGTSGTGFVRLLAGGAVDKSFGTNGFAQSNFTGPIVVYGNRLYVLGGGDTGDGKTGERIVAFLLNTSARYVKVNLYGNSDPYNNRQWNNWNNLRNLHFYNFYYSDSTSSTISAVMSNRNGVNDNGTSYGSGMAPAGVLRHSSYSIGSRTITLSGLAASKKYSIELYGSRNAYPDNNTVFSINGISKTIATYRNFTNKAVFTNLTPNTKGQIVITISSTKTYNYLNGFTLIENGASTTTAQVLDNNITQAAQPKQNATASAAFQIAASPNPSPRSFTLQLKSSAGTTAQVRVFDAAGRLVEARQKVASNTSLVLGTTYKPGVYYAEVIQDGQRKLVRLVKVAR